MLFFVALVTIILLLAKVFGLIAISWLAVFSPLLVGAAIIVLLFLIGVVAVFLAADDR